jgi:hypothetical protein
MNSLVGSEQDYFPMQHFPDMVVNIIIYVNIDHLNMIWCAGHGNVFMAANLPGGSRTWYSGNIQKILIADVIRQVVRVHMAAELGLRPQEKTHF